MGAASSEVARRFGQNMRHVRKGTGLSQEALGFEAGLHRTEIGLLERGARVPRIDTLLKIAAGLGVKVESPLLNGMAWSSGSRTTTPGAFRVTTSQEQHAEAMALAAEACEGQTETVDAAALVREVRDEMEGRTGCEGADE
jgi:transcriptional regulator with XRE-family HTH domain